MQEGKDTPKSDTETSSAIKDNISSTERFSHAAMKPASRFATTSLSMSRDATVVIKSWDETFNLRLKKGQFYGFAVIMDFAANSEMVNRKIKKCTKS